MNPNSFLPLLAAASLALLPALAGAVDVGDGKLTIRGNGSWSWQKTTNDATYLRGDKDGDWDTAHFDLALIARPMEELSLNFQVSFNPAPKGSEGGETTSTSLDWAFLDWRVSDALHVRAGKVKQPFGNYAEIQSVGTLRPFQDLPTSIYGPANIFAVAYQGAGLTGSLPFAGDWTFAYDLFGGAVFLESYEPFDSFNGELAPTPPVPTTTGERVENVYGGRVSVTTPGGWTFRASAFGGKVEKDEGETLVYYSDGLSAWYRGDRLWLSAEAFYSREKGFESTWAGYAEAAWFFTEKVQVAGRYEISRTEAEGLSGKASRLKRHDAGSVSFNYWLSPVAVLRVGADYVAGSRFLGDEDWGVWNPADPATQFLPERETVRLVAGAQFGF